MADYTVNLKFPLVKTTPDICDEGTEADCQLTITRDFAGAPAPADTYGNLAVVNIPLKPLDTDCDVEIAIALHKGCPAGTPDLEWDTDLSPSSINRDESLYVYIKEGFPPFDWEIVGGHGFTLEFSETTGRQNTLIADSEACGTAEIQVIDMCQTEIVGEVTCQQSSTLAWDWNVSAQTILKGESGKTIAIIEGVAPYSWRIEGQDFSLGQGITTSRFNTVNAGLCACGSAEITVTDACGDETVGSVRCTDSGHWEEKGGTIIEKGNYLEGAGNCISTHEMEFIQGDLKVYENIGTVCQDMGICGAYPDCVGCSSPSSGWDKHSCCFPSDEIDCMEYRAKCDPSPGLTKVGFCCKSGGSGIISRLGVNQRRVWEWAC